MLNRPGSIQTKKQKQFVHDFERCHWEALQVYSNEDIGAAAASAVDKNEAATVDLESHSDNVSSYASSLATSPISISKSTGDVNSTSASVSKKSPRTLRKVMSRNSLDSDASQETSKQSYSQQSYSQNSIDGRSSSIDKDLQTPRSSINDTCIMLAKSISQSLRDQQYSLPVHELNYFQLQSNFSKSDIGAGYQGLLNGTLDLHWNHKCVLICANVLKESCSLTRISFEIIDNIRQNPGPGSLSAAHINVLRRKQSVENLLLIAKAMTGLSVNAKGELEIIPNDMKQMAQNLLNSVNDDHDDNSDNGYPTDKKHENSMTRLKNFKSEINKGTWDRLHSASEILFLISYGSEGTKSSKTSEKKKIDEITRIDTLNSDLSNHLSYISENEILNRKESIAVICDLFLDFIDSRSDTIFDENLCKRLLIAWKDEYQKQNGDFFNKNENLSPMDVDESKNTISSSRSKAITNCEELKKKKKNTFSDKMLSNINEILKNEKLER